MAKDDNTERFRGRYRIPSARLSDYDYGTPGLYFVTICTQDRQCHFGDGDVVDGHVQRSSTGQRAHDNWQAIPTYFDHVRLDAFVIMPNHIHGLIGLISRPDRDINANNNVETCHWRVSTGTNDTENPVTDDTPTSRNQFMSAITPDAGSLPVIINQYKGAVTRWARENEFPNFAWQARYYDRVVRNQHEHNCIRQYIEANPARWHCDRNHPDYV